MNGDERDVVARPPVPDQRRHDPARADAPLIANPDASHRNALLQPALSLRSSTGARHR
ncbi:hypothetical protein ACFYOT_29505 [Saccharothrix saharensis]|uniref:hypothetical protein n=1 Tax=Saccharothrix saharensis TaxID=571190 RepID=UPI0036B26A57